MEKSRADQSPETATSHGLITSAELEILFKWRDEAFADTKIYKDIYGTAVNTIQNSVSHLEGVLGCDDVDDHKLLIWKKDGLSRHDHYDILKKPMLAALQDCYLLGRYVQGEAISKEEFSSWNNPELVRPRRFGGGILKQLVKFTAKVSPDLPTILDKEGIEPEDLFTASSAMALLHAGAFDIVLATEAVTYMKQLPRAIRRRSGIDASLPTWIETIRELVHEGDTENHTDMRRIITSGVFFKLQRLPAYASKYGSDPILSQLIELAKINYDTFKDTKESSVYIDQVFAAMKKRKQEADAKITLNIDTEPQDNTVRTLKDQVLIEISEPDASALEGESSTVDYSEVTDHVKELQVQQMVLTKTWFNKQALKDAGFHEFTRTMVNGLDEEGASFPAMASHDVWAPAGLLFQTNNLIQEAGHVDAKQILAADYKLDLAITHDVDTIGAWLRSHGESNGRRLDKSLAETVAHICENWDAYEDLILARWPDENIDIDAIKELLFGVWLNDVEPIILSPETKVTPKEDITEQVAGQVEVNDEPHIDLELVGIADALTDFVVLPEGKGIPTAQSIFDAYPIERKSFVSMERIKNLASLKDNKNYNATLYRSKESMFGRNYPYYVLELDIKGVKIVVAESIEYGNATYIVREDFMPGTWQEVLSLPRISDVRQLEAKFIIHSDDNDTNHFKKIVERINELATVKPLVNSDQ